VSSDERSARAAAGWTALALTTLITGACAGPGASAAPASTSARPVITDHQRGWFSLADGAVHLAGDDEPVGLYVSGVIEGGRFVPEGDVLGQGPIGASGTPGWLELLDGGFHPRHEGREPGRPYVAGTMTAEGVFSPGSRQVAY
jgi:hypothetical protein